jgi:hypothetical protein
LKDNVIAAIIAAKPAFGEAAFTGPPALVGKIP